ncbi:uncharacterized protein LOC103307821 [Acyrthosiphon pisum]|uniref:THAP-type domain-containing protein n=1 Tax=Acyrthosiphon pisum TaxID=7029 RepID=A0A8R2AYP8_ACYPI|nr:uncharacterized protein LOC103307821 [Acyrthosiphon pisum]|eukprot:XP_008178371.1 PREDICTED: uncharacterized protein LOC103307821 [Acyrthosiphon pisum]
MVQKAVSDLRYKNKLLHQKDHRLQKKVESLNEMISVLKKKSMISDNAAINLKVFLQIVAQTVPTSVNNILCCHLLVNIIPCYEFRCVGKNSKRIIDRKKNMFLVKRLDNLQLLYNINLHVHTHVRKTFANVLPHPRTLRRWYMVVDGKPCFTKESFETIKNKVLDSKVYCNLTVDEMCVKTEKAY